MKKIKRISSVMIILSILINIPAFSFENEINKIDNIFIGENDNPKIEINKITKEEFDNRVENIDSTEENVDLEEKKDILKKEESIILKIDELNFYKPLEIVSLKNNQYQIKLADILFKYGKVRLHIVGDGEDIPFSSIVSKGEEIKFILQSNDYNCEILITDEATNSRITFIGKILDGQYELQWIDESNSKDISIQAVINESEPNDNMSQADLIGNGDDVYGTMTADREDYYKIIINTVGRINFWIGQIPSGKNYNLYVYQGSSLIGSDTRVGLTQKLIQKDNQPMGTYYVRVSYPSGTLPTSTEKYWLRVKSYQNLGWPVSNQSMLINACFGNCAQYPVALRPHNGIDLNAPMNTSIYAAGQGTVTYSGREYNTGTGTYGKFIDIVHTEENPRSTGDANKYIKTRYAHLDVLSTSVGSTVSMGNKIAESGKSGYKIEADGTINLNPYGPHLHFETLVGSSKTGSTWTRIQPLEYYPGKRCACGISFNSFNPDISSSYFTRSVGIYINEEYFIDIETLLNMTHEELERYGITKDKLSKFDTLIKSDEEIHKLYNEEIEGLIQSYK